MKKNFITKATLLSFVLVMSTFSCTKEFADSPSGFNGLNENSTATLEDRGAPDYNKLADTLAYRLKGKCVGYSFVVNYKGQYKTSRSGGQSRRAQDAPVKAMTMYEKFSIASVSKTITATALIKRMNEIPGGINNLDVPMWTYLPAHWQMGPNIKTITFRELLNHTSGLRYSADQTKNGDDYQTLKSLIAAGISLGNKSYSYNNRNFALMRLIIPKMANYNITVISNNFPANLIQALEVAQAAQFANDYKDYCRQVIFNKLGTTATQTIDCVNSDASPALCYVFPLNGTKGYLPGDMTLISGAQGWVLTTIQVNDFFNTLEYTQTLLSSSLSKLMRDQKLGFDAKAKTTDGIDYYWKNGVYDFGNPIYASYRSLIIGFGDDVQIAMMTNSAINLQNAAITAHQDWHP